MIHLLYGQDTFSRQEAVTAIKIEAAPAELGDVNVNVLNGSQVTFEELAATCDTVPFLADKRLVVVEGLLSTFERGLSARPTTTEDTKPGLGPWEGLSDYLDRVPETTELVFVDGQLANGNRLLAIVKPKAQVRTFQQPRAREIRPWIQRRADAEGIDIEPRAVDTLADTAGSDLGVIVSELRKLSLYRAGETIRHEDVQELVPYAREARIFDAVDAVVEGKVDAALDLVHRLLRGGSPVPFIFAMLARQVRLLVLAKDLKAEGVPAAEHGKRLGISGYPLQKTQDQERRFTSERLVDIHNKLLEADLSLKTTSVDDGLILDLLVAEIATMPAGRRGSPREVSRR